MNRMDVSHELLRVIRRDKRRYLPETCGGVKGLEVIFSGSLSVSHSKQKKRKERKEKRKKKRK